MFDPDGVRWTIRRRWTPRWTRVDVGTRFRQFHRRGSGSRKERRQRTEGKERKVSWSDFLEFPVDDLGLLAIVLAVIAAALLLWFAVIPLLLILFDILVVLVLFIAGITARVLLRRPWTVVATRIDGVEIEREVVGWRASRDEMATMRRQLEQGLISPAPPHAGSPPAPF